VQKIGALAGMDPDYIKACMADEDLKKAKTTDWFAVELSTDCIHQFFLEGLKPATTYYYASETKAEKKDTSPVVFRGKFATAPNPDSPSNLRFCLMTCQGYPDRGHPAGHHIYPAMQALNPQFACLTGDLVYYDNDMPRASSERLARYHWERMFSLPRLLEFNRNVGTYWLKDDHDTLDNDSAPGGNMGELSFAEGQNIFKQQAPFDPKALSYRTFRWGKDLQIWLTDGRDFRSPNDLPDGPDKTILGLEQKAWLNLKALSKHKFANEHTFFFKELPDRIARNE
jgi:alkaline phosphatase D